MNWLLLVLIFLSLLFLFYLFFIFGSFRDTSRQMKPFLHHYIAHRGFYNKKKKIPENSLPAFENAVKNGYGIELDVALSKDGIPVIFHDEHLQRVCHQPGAVYDYTLEELQKFPLQKTECVIPTFEEVLHLINGQVPVIVEIKSEGDWQKTCEKAACLLDAYNGSFCVESFSPLAVRWFKEHRKDWVRGQLAETVREKDGKPEFLQWILEQMLCNFLSRPDFIAYEYSRKPPFVVKIFQIFCRRNYRVVWTIKNQNELELAKKTYQIFIFEGFHPKLEEPSEAAD